MHFLNTRLFIYNFVNFESPTQTWIGVICIFWSDDLYKWCFEEVMFYESVQQNI